MSLRKLALAGAGLHIVSNMNISLHNDNDVEYVPVRKEVELTEIPRTALPTFTCPPKEYGMNKKKRRKKK